MVSGSHNVANNPPPDNDTLYNCVQQVTRIPIVTVLAVGLEIIVLLGLLLFDVILLLSVRFKPGYKNVEDMPNDVLEMQLAFVRQLENDTEKKIQPKHLVSYVYGFDKEKDMDMLRFQRVGSAPVCWFLCKSLSELAFPKDLLRNVLNNCVLHLVQDPLRSPSLIFVLLLTFSCSEQEPTPKHSTLLSATKSPRRAYERLPSDVELGPIAHTP